MATIAAPEKKSAPAPTAPRHTYDAAPGQRFVIRTGDWASYRALADLLRDCHIRLTYDRGNLEFMTISRLHVRWSKLIGRMVEMLTEELNMPRQSGGSTTLNLEEADRGMEPDQCYYLENEAKVRHLDEIDLTRDPPPDLAIEVEVTRSALNRLGVYAALGVPEVWRFDGQALHILRRTDAGTYAEVERSPHFPFLPPAEIVSLLNRRHEVSETELMRTFRTWVREHMNVQ